MLASLLLVVGLQAASVPWYTEPVAVDLHPVHASAWARYHALYVEKVTGRNASPVFREPFSQAEVYYRLWDLTGEPPPLESAMGERWRDAAISSASIAAEAFLWDTVGRSPEFDGAVRFMRTFVAPNLELQRGGQGWRVKVNDPEVRLRPRLDRAELSEGLPGPPEPSPSLSVGSGLEVGDLDQLTTPKRDLDVAAWVRLRDVGIDQLTLRGLAGSRSWEVSGRQRVLPRTSLSLAVASREADPTPRDMGAAATWTLPWLHWWTLTLRGHAVVPVLPTEPPERSLSLILRWLPPAKAPVQPGRWPLGQRVGAPGPWFPAPPPGAPIETHLLVATGSSSTPR
ncbi:MAG: hypothetical protein ABIO70_23355 [Pseudomonadota bacterium]